MSIDIGSIMSGTDMYLAPLILPVLKGLAMVDYQI